MAIEALVEWTVEHPERLGLARWESCIGTVTDASDPGGRPVLIRDRDGRHFSAEE
jgi:hypothetical protein